MQLSENEKQAILDRIALGSATHEDKQRIRQLLLINDDSFLTELIKYNVRIENGCDVHIGDKITIDFNEQVFTQVLEGLERSGWRMDNSVEQDLEVIEAIEIDFNLIGSVNRHLDLLKTLRDESRLSNSQDLELQDIQRKVRVINLLEQDLKLIERKAKRMLEDIRKSLSVQLENTLQNQSSELIHKYDKEAEDISSQLAVVETFIQGLEDGNLAAQWIQQSASQLKQTAIARLENEYSEIFGAATSKQIDDFDFSIEQFLEQIAHALRLGNNSIFDNSAIPLCFNNSALYIAVFQHIKQLLPQRSLPSEAIALVEECLDDLILSLQKFY